jgi:RHS repeat-associated protein
LGLIGEETGSKYTSYHFDLRGSTIALTNSTGQITEKFQYSPYGVLLSSNAEKTPFLFNGMYGVMTDSNGLYYMRARFYSPEMRRFVNQDILLGFVEDGQTLNRYAYVTGDPISKIDPFGLSEYCGKCAIGETEGASGYDCLIYGGNLCNVQPRPRPYVGVSSERRVGRAIASVGWANQASVVRRVGRASAKPTIWK